MSQLVEVFHPRRLNDLIGNHDGVAAIRLARSLRGEGYRGAVWYEFLAAVAQRTPRGIEYAREIAHSIRAWELYEDLPLSLPLDFTSATRFASWILHHDWRARDPGFNPGHRLQTLLSASENETNTSMENALLAERAIEQGELAAAFRLLVPSMTVSGGDTWVCRVALLLFRAIPRCLIRDVLMYQENGVRSFGIAPIKNEGYIFTEYTGAILDRPLLFRRTVPMMPVVQFIDGMKSSMEDLALVLSAKACDVCPRLSGPGRTLVKKAV